MESMESTANANDGVKRKSGDIGWEYGKLVDPTNLDKTQCLLCGKLMSGGVYRIKQHITGSGSNVVSCKKASKEDQLRVREALSEVKNKKKAKQQRDVELRSKVNIDSSETIDLDDEFGELKGPKSSGPMHRYASSSFQDPKEKTKKSKLNNVVLKEQMGRVKEYICEWAYQSSIPFHAFENDAFKKVMEAIGQLGPNGMPPTRYEMSETYLKKSVEKKKVELKKYEEEWKDIGCSIMIDAWTDRQRRSIMNLCVNSKLGTIFLSSKECSDEAHTSEYIFEYVDKAIEEIGPENVVQVVTDNASNNVGASKLLKRKRPQIFWTSCATHTINLMLEGIGGLKRYKQIIDQAQKLTIFIYSHDKTLAMMRKYTKKRNIVRPGVTKFASAFLTLQSLMEKRSQLRGMFTSADWDACKLSESQKGKMAYAMVVSPEFWSGVSICLKVFSPLVNVLRMVDADWKPSMGFIYGELKRAKKEIALALNNDESACKAIMKIISKKSSKRLDTCLHMAAYILNPYYYYNDKEAREDLDANDAVVDFIGVLFPGDYDMQNKILDIELPTYKKKQGKFERPVALRACEVNNEHYDPANWWENYGSMAPNLKKIAIRILSLTTSSLGCERNWSMFEGVRTKTRNRLEANRLNDLVFVQFNANLMERNKKRKLRNREVLVAEDSNGAKEWIVDGGDEDEDESGLTWKTVSEATGTDEMLRNRTSARTKARTSVGGAKGVGKSAKTSARDLIDEEFESDEKRL